jgi:hypothetical protein
MDLQTLCTVLQACVNPDATIRRAAEAQLLQARPSRRNAARLAPCRRPPAARAAAMRRDARDAACGDVT